VGQAGFELGPTFEQASSIPSELHCTLKLLAVREPYTTVSYQLILYQTRQLEI
jgi:hypothetical protein